MLDSTRFHWRQKTVENRLAIELRTRALSPLDAVRICESEEKEGGTQTREQWSPLLVSGSLINEPREERDGGSR